MSSSLTTSPSTIRLEPVHHDDSSSKDLNPPNIDEESSSSTSNGDNDNVDSHSSPSHHLEGDDSPLDCPSLAPLWACRTLESTGDWVGDLSDTRRTRSQFQEVPHLFVASISDPESFQEASGIPKWDATMQEEFNSLERNHTWDLVPLPKEGNLFDASGSIKQNLQ